MPGVLSTADKVVGRCVRPAGHEGQHRWSERWERMDPAEVEAEIEADRRKWEPDEDT